VSVDELAAAVWGDDLPRNPPDQVSILVSRLRGVLGSDRLPRSDAGYCLAADWFDSVELEKTVTEIEQRLRSGEAAAALAAAHVALGLAAGELLSEEDGDWVDAARPAAARLVARARLLAAEAALEAGEFGAARTAGQAVLDVDPYDEAALRLVMRSDALAGRPGAALAAYAAVRHRLSEDLGVDPTPQTESLHTAIARGATVGVRDSCGLGPSPGTRDRIPDPRHCLEPRRGG
jgi:DNA-binding SARP family transcriptional activator